MTDVEALVLREARLLDERRYAEWLALFEDDGVYWVPGQAAQASPRDGLSIVYEPRALLAMRIERLVSGLPHVQSPPSRTVHHVSGIEVEADGLTAHSALVMAEWRAGDARWFAARVEHRLRRSAHGLGIVRKRVDIIDSEAPHRALAVPF